jgi:hypothetical protein
MTDGAGSGKRLFASRGNRFVNETLLSLTLRRWRETVVSWRFAGLVVVLSALLVYSGPFGTLAMPFARRLVYWSLLVAIDAAVGVLAGIAAAVALAPLVPPLFPRLLAGGFAAAVPIALTRVILQNLLSETPITAAEWPQVWLSTAAISVGIAAIVGLVSRDPRSSLPAASPETAIPMPNGQDAGNGVVAVAAQPGNSPFFKRLPQQVGRDLLYLSMQDHYVEAHTRLGHALVLMRLADAIREIEPIAGLQIHRSHWVARSAIDHVERENGRLTVILVNGARLPVSRSYADAVRGVDPPAL